MMAQASYIVWLAEADAPVFENAFPHATFLRQDRVERGVVVYRVALDIRPSYSMFPLVDSVYWNNVYGGFRDADGSEVDVPYVSTHTYALEQPAPPNIELSSESVRWKMDQWIVTSDLELMKAQHGGWKAVDDVYQVWVFNKKERAETKIHRLIRATRED